MRKINIIVLLVFLLLVSLGNAAGQSFSSASFITRQASVPSFQTYYGSEGRLGTYWPILDDPKQCQGRQDILLQVAPVGCQPAVVRSDLLAEQNVPVFCQIDALKINPLLDIKDIRNIRFTGNYPKEVAGTGFHPARAALLTRDRLLGDPIINNIGYVVVVLKKTPNESAVPDKVELNLRAQIDYESGNALGIGKAEFLLQEQSDDAWKNEKDRQSFWNGKYFVRLEELEQGANNAVVGLYVGDRKLTSVKVDRGGISREIYTPGSYCQAALQVAFVGVEQAKKKATLEIGMGNSMDKFDVFEGSSFLNGKCSVDRISIDDSTLSTGSVIVRCPSGKLVLTLGAKSNAFVVFNVDGKQIKPEQENGRLTVDFGAGFGKYALQADGSLSVLKEGDSAKAKDAAFREKVKSALKAWQAQSAGGKEPKALSESTYSKEIEQNFSAAISAYEEVAKDYPAEKDINGNYGEQALLNAISLARLYGKEESEVRLAGKFVQQYPTSESISEVKDRLEKLYAVDSSNAGSIVELDNRYRSIRLTGVQEPTQKSKAVLLHGSKSVEIELSGNYSFTIPGGRADNDGDKRYIRLDRLDADRITISSNCEDVPGANRIRKVLGRKDIAVGESKTVCGQPLVFKQADLHEFARIQLRPKALNTNTETNLTVKIGIEKRAIKLTPEKTKERIQILNDSVKKWESISKNLGTAVSGLKAACFATSAVLTLKNFYTGLSGQALARQDVMRGDKGWTEICKKEVYTDKTSPTMDACFLKHNGEIEQDVKARQAQIEKTNSKIKETQKVISSNIIQGTNIDTKASAKALGKSLRDEHGNEQLNLPGNKRWVIPGKENSAKVKDVVTDENIESGLVSYIEVRQIYTELNSKKNGGYTSAGKENIDSKLLDVSDRINGNIGIDNRYKEASSAEALGLPQAIIQRTVEGTTPGAVVSVKSLPASLQNSFTNKNIKYSARYSTLNSGSNGQGQSAGYKPADYLLGLEEVEPGTGNYKVVEAVEIWKEGDTYHPVSDNYYTPKTDLGGFLSAYNLGTIQGIDKLSYNNKIQNPEIRYYETEPYKGMPAVVPFDVQRGWYAGTKQTLPVFGGIGAFDASGKVSSFWICNVGKNGRIDFEQSGFGDDNCQRFDLNTGQALNVFPGLSKAEADRLVTKAIAAIQEAARQYEAKNKYVSISGAEIRRGRPMSNAPETSCQTFMSAQECQILFNVCDPVICPASRCDFGGQYPVADVIQTGIIGSTLLCLPNVRAGIYIPVCLSGIQAGVDGYVSILKQHRDCLQENLNSGKIVGICDLYTSIYQCQFFWQQLAPLTKLIIPKLFEIARGQGTHGGGEYLTVMGAWQNTQASINYFTNVYGVNSFKAFQARSVEEAGGELCKGFVSAKIPTSFKKLVQPDSPTQFYAYFSSSKYTDATVPATAQYSVFYHIFAGKDAGVAYRVYLKNPPSSSYYAANPYLDVATGFIGRGESKDDKRDFTAPEGYKELCVNINGEEKCGFKQVTTSFAVNYLKDSIVADQIKDSNIQSEQQCISGDVNAAALLNPNLQFAAEEALNPDTYRRGVVRICSTENPGSSTDPRRYVDVGYCSDQKVRCWLDSKSIANAITDNNKLVRNQTLQEIEKLQRQNFAKDKSILTDQDANAELADLKGKANGIPLKKGYPLEATELRIASYILNRVELVKDALFLNYQKAQLALIKADVLDYLARNVLPVGTGGAGVDLGVGGEPPAGEGGSTAGQIDSEEQIRTSEIYLLAKQNEADRDTYFRFNPDSKVWEWSLDYKVWQSLKEVSGNYEDGSPDFAGINAQKVFPQLDKKTFDEGQTILLKAGAKSAGLASSFKATQTASAASSLHQLINVKIPEGRDISSIIFTINPPGSISPFTFSKDFYYTNNGWKVKGSQTTKIAEEFLPRLQGKSFEQGIGVMILLARVNSDEKYIETKAVTFRPGNNDFIVKDPLRGQELIFAYRNGNWAWYDKQGRLKAVSPSLTFFKEVYTNLQKTNEEDGTILLFTLNDISLFNTIKEQSSTFGEVKEDIVN